MFSMKVCCTCKIELPASEFGPSKQTKDGLRRRCKSCHNKGNAEYRARHPEKSKAASLRWQAANRDKANEKQRRWKEANPGRASFLVHRWRCENLERARANERRLMGLPEYRIKRTIASRISRLLGGKGGRSTTELIGYSASELRAHIERQFLPGMSWANYGEWHIDHIVPVSSFNISSIDDPSIRSAWGLPNLRPLWAADNHRKHAKRTHLI